MEILTAGDTYPSLTATSKETNQKEIRRKNTLIEKRRMRNLRKKRKRKQRAAFRKEETSKETEILKSELKVEQQKQAKSEHKIEVLKCMARTYWERWHWELEKRKEALRECRRSQNVSLQLPSSTLHEIDPAMLTEPIVEGQQKEHYVGRGSFSVVKAQYYRGCLVAVKRFLGHSLKEDVIKEATIVSKLSHPCLPFLYGVCTSGSQYKIVMQFHGIMNGDLPKTLSLYEELKYMIIGIKETDCLIMCTQLLEAVDYLHCTAFILHNDIKTDNILINKLSTPICTRSDCTAVLIDFGKATMASQGKRYRLTLQEIQDYQRKYVHLAPEVINGEHKQSTYSDIFSVGGVLYRVTDSGFIQSKEISNGLNNLGRQCQIPLYTSRPSAKRVLMQLKTVIDTAT